MKCAEFACLTFKMSDCHKPDPLIETLLLAVHELRGIHEQLRTAHNNHAILDRLAEIKEQIIMTVQQGIDIATQLSTVSDSLSTKLDHLEADVTALIGSLGTADLTPEQEAAVAKVSASLATTTAQGDKVDAAIVAADKVLPTPAPAG